MKTVYDNSMVAHIWAHQSQLTARNANTSFWFEGPVLYSYRTPVAMIHEARTSARMAGADSNRVALITSDGYSMTTKSKHLNPARHALIGMARTFRVPYVGAYGGIAPGTFGMEGDYHEKNLAHLVDEYTALAGRLLRARDLYSTPVGIALAEAAQIAFDYADAFGLERPALTPDLDATDIAVKRAKREARANDPAQIAKRERAKARAEERKAEKEAAERLARFQREVQAREAFREGRPGYWRCSDEYGGALLRVDGDVIRTSWGAEVPVEHARRAFPLIARIRDFGETWQPNGHTVHLGHFALHAVNADGSIRAGCHLINWPEIERTARALGLLAS